MFKKFTLGLFFGAGFSLSAIFLYTIWILYILPPLMNPSGDFLSESTSTKSSSQLPYPSPGFHEMTVDEKIASSTAILLLKIEEIEDNFYVSTVDEVLKKTEGVELYYAVGDIYDERTSAPRVPQKAIVFMTGNPATEISTSFFDDDRITSLGGISLSLLRKNVDDT